jgi:hypothetical protein
VGHRWCFRDHSCVKLVWNLCETRLEWMNPY